MRDWLTLLKHCHEKNHQQITKKCGKKSASWISMFCQELEKRIDSLRQKYQTLSYTELKEMAKYRGLAVPRSKQKVIDTLLESSLKCLNHFTLYGDEIKEVPFSKLWITSNGYCHEIDELMEYLISSEGRNIDPLDSTNTIPIWNTDKEKTRLLQSKGIDPTIKKRYQQMIQNKKSIDIPFSLPELETILDEIAKTSFILLNDKPFSFSDSGFSSAEEALGHFSNFLSLGWTTEQQQFIRKKLKNGTAPGTIDSILNDHSSCVHKKGNMFLEIYLYQIRQFSFSPIAFIQQVAPTVYATPRLRLEHLKDYKGSTTYHMYIITVYNSLKDQMIQTSRMYTGSEYPQLLKHPSKSVQSSIHSVLKEFQV